MGADLAYGQVGALEQLLGFAQPQGGDVFHGAGVVELGEGAAKMHGAGTADLCQIFHGKVGVAVVAVDMRHCLLESLSLAAGQAFSHLCPGQGSVDLIKNGLALQLFRKIAQLP